MQQLKAENQTNLRLITSGLSGALLRYEPVPSLLADKTFIRTILSDPDSKFHVEHANRELEAIANKIGASDVYVMDKSGITIASSNHNSDVSFLGRNFSYRPYFTNAIKGEFTHYFALGTTSLKRGYYFAAPIRNNQKLAGVVTVKIGVDQIENDWRDAPSEIIVSDKSGVIFMASDRSRLFKAMTPLTLAALSRIELSQRYPIDQLSDLEMATAPSGISDLEETTITANNEAASYFKSSVFMADAGWTVHILAPRDRIVGKIYAALAIITLALLLVTLLAGITILRRAQLMQNIEMQRRNQLDLERRVAERTDELHSANRLLTKEVKDRTQAEQQLRSTQQDLLQAGKLAALGQMSAALSHELNQPLTAIKSYAENARKYLSRNNTKQVDENISHISEMSDRMAEIGSYLRNFARKPRQVIENVELCEIMDGLMHIMHPRLKAQNAEIILTGFNAPIMVKGGQNRLQQVLVNLANNALDASEGKEKSVIEISVRREEQHTILDVRDYGEGIDVATKDEIFDPFFTTKGINKGLGLGLSISFNIVQDFGGSLTASNHPDGGAVFHIRLNNAEKSEMAAE